MIFTRPDQVKPNNQLYVVTSLFNPIRWRSRWKLYLDFARHVEESEGVLYTAEVAFGKRKSLLQDTMTTLAMATRHELWLKENALNLAIQRLPDNWEYVAWVDSDVQFVREDWANETVHQLQHYDMVQMFSEAADLDSKHQICQKHKGFAWCYHNGVPICQLDEDPYYYVPPPQKGVVYWHPGYAWAARRSAFEKLGGLIDYSVFGSADWLMARALIDKLPECLYLGEHGLRWLQIWNDRAKLLHKNIGYVDGLLLHNWHGSKADRKYRQRALDFRATNFDPEADLKRDWQGLWQLTDNNPALRDALRCYFRGRNEDMP